MDFYVIDGKEKIRKDGVYLEPDSWDDWFQFETSYWLYIRENGINNKLGRVKIAKTDQQERRTNLPNCFQKLDDSFFSIGFDSSYYENFKNFNRYRSEVLTALNDMAYNLDIYEKYKSDSVVKTSLLRSYTISQLKGQLHRVARGGKKLTPYNFSYVYPYVDIDDLNLNFVVNPEMKPSSNIHVLIGKNGVGKTSVLKKMLLAIETKDNCDELKNQDKFLIADESEISNILFVSFSAFDTPIFFDSDKCDIPYQYVGLITEDKRVKDRNDLANEFVQTTYNFYRSESKMLLWESVVQILKSDDAFDNSQFESLISFDRKFSTKDIINEKYKGCSGDEKRKVFQLAHKELVQEQFLLMSSGHKNILLTLAKLVDLVEEKTLVLMDEPEEHLHPPLVSTFIQALNYILRYQNGVAIIATHSPVVVQEVPRSCVWKLSRYGNYLVADRPSFETYGSVWEKINDEIFGLEISKSGFHQEVQKVTTRVKTYEDALSEFNGNLGSEAKSILRAYLYNKR